MTGFRILAAAAAVAVAVAAPAFAADDDFGPLVTADELDALIQGDDAPLVLDIRAADESGYAGGHIPGAVNAPYQLFRGPADNPGQVPDDATLSATYSDLGITPDQPIVVVHQGSDETDFGAAARVYWTLKSTGISHLAILNGGLNAWTDAGLALSDDPVTPEKSAITVTLSHEWLADADDVQAVLDGKVDAELIDARPRAYWEGEEVHPAAARPGTLPESRDVPHSTWFENTTAMADARAVRDRAADEGLADAPEIVSFCNTGHWAATNWFALSELAGEKNVKLYPESIVGWSKDDAHAMINVPGRIGSVWNQIKKSF